ncbi:uncharacterized protein LOC115769434 [Drosophila novamexicana]|uniref:uncharacterized protein LOC115769434 n=1 Tax=Drosophila novamexicana TaxID=47314 RepID=UPI0011E5A6A8|nr:uncharacterized protein LOC115769434 [Drosophila novamexicana]
MSLLAFLSIQAAPTDSEIAATSEEPLAESRSQKQDQDISDVDDDLDGRSAYVNNQFVPSEPVELVDDEQNTPLYEILQKQMEQVLAATGPDVPIYEDEKSKRQRVQHPPNKPLFTNNAADADDDYVDEAAQEPEQGYGEADKPDAVTGEELPDAGYQVPPLSASSAKPTNSITTQPPSSSSTTTIRNRPQRRRTTTLLPRTTRARASTQSKTTVTTQSSVNRTELTTSTTTTAAPPAASQKPRPHTKPIPSSIQPHDPQIYQHKRRIIFKTISTGSQFVNSPIGDLMIKFSIGFAKPAPGVVTPSNEAIRALSQNLLRSIELQKLKRINKIQRD